MIMTDWGNGASFAAEETGAEVGVTLTDGYPQPTVWVRQPDGSQRVVAVCVDGAAADAFIETVRRLMEPGNTVLAAYRLAEKLGFHAEDGCGPCDAYVKAVDNGMDPAKATELRCAWAQNIQGELERLVASDARALTAAAYATEDATGASA
jgi:hypothetical protein